MRDLYKHSSVSCSAPQEVYARTRSRFRAFVHLSFKCLMCGMKDKARCADDDDDDGVSVGKAYVKYLNPNAAAYARDKLNMLEYPPGYRMNVQFIARSHLCLSLCLSVCLSVCLCVSLYVCLSPPYLHLATSEM